MLRILRFLVIIICLGFGVIGAIMPLIPGWLGFGVAALLLFPDSKLAKKATHWIAERAPRLGRALRALQNAGR